MKRDSGRGPLLRRSTSRTLSFLALLAFIALMFATMRHGPRSDRLELSAFAPAGRDPMLHCPGSVPTTPMVVENIKMRLIETMRTALKGVKKVAFIGMSMHNDKTDSAITMGELSILNELGINIVYRGIEGGEREAEVQANEIRARLGTPRDDVAVLFHGGGNFGDVWRDQHRFRLFVMKRLLDFRLVVLPQSVLLSSDGTFLLDETKEIYDQASSLTLIARDASSLRFLAQHFGQHRIFLCPDSAFILAPQNVSGVLAHRRLSRDIDILYLFRSDKESKFPENETQPSAIKKRHPGLRVEVNDWIAHGEPLTLSATSSPDPVLANSERTRLGFEFLARSKVIVTDRLHGLVMASILDLPVVFLDLDRITGFHDTWMLGADNVVSATTISEAARLAEDLFERDFVNQRADKCRGRR